jgi:hypothetical protein
VKRISFLTFCRLDQDSIELLHHTDSKGMTTANLVWRTDPGIHSAENVEVVPSNPNDTPPPVLIVVDSFRPPSGKVWRYIPGYGTYSGADWLGIHWGAERSESDLIADDPSLPVGVGDVFPPYNPLGTFFNTITVPDTGSFLVRAGLYFINQYGFPDTIYWRISFMNSNLDPVETILGGTVPIDLSFRSTAQSGREQVYYAKIDPDQPLRVQIDFKFLGSGNLYATCNPDGDCDPYHGYASAKGGDSYFIIEWWPD